MVVKFHDERVKQNWKECLLINYSLLIPCDYLKDFQGRPRKVSIGSNVSRMRIGYGKPMWLAGDVNFPFFVALEI